MNDIKKKIEKIIKKKMCDKGLKNCTYRQETVDAIEVLFEEEKRKAVTDMAKSAIDESDKSLVGLAEDLRRIFLSDLTELENWVTNHQLNHGCSNPSGWDINFKYIDTKILLSKLQEIKTKYKETDV